MKDFLFISILNMSITASYVALIIVIARMFLKKAPKVFSYALWSVLLFRLLSPMSFKSPISLLRPLNSNNEYIPRDIGMMNIPEVRTNIQTIDKFINKSLPVPKPISSINPIQLQISIFASLWIIGIAVLIIYSVYSYIKISKKVQYATLMKDNIFETDQIKTPFVLGIIKPKIYLPIGLKSDELSYIINHERTHIKRRDYLIKPIFFLALILHWFNPIIWLSYFLMIKDMEMSCDERVIKGSNTDIRGNYTNSLLSLSIKHNGLLIPLAFGESNIKTRIKNILNYKKTSFWGIIAALLVVVIFATGLLSNPFTLKNPEVRARKFLKEYYTIDNYNIADLLHNDPIDSSIINIDNNSNESKEIGLLNNPLRSKYGDLMTENAFNISVANRIILEGELAAREFDSTLEVESINLWDEKISDNGDITYQYSLSTLVKFKDNNEELVNLKGSLVMKDEKGIWKVNEFKPNLSELKQVLQFGKPYLYVTNQSDVPIKIVEIHFNYGSEGAMNANYSNMEKGSNFMFEMHDSKKLDFTVEILDPNKNAIVAQEFTEDFSEGKDVYLYIQEDSSGKLIISDKKLED